MIVDVHAWVDCMFAYPHHALGITKRRFSFLNKTSPRRKSLFPEGSFVTKNVAITKIQ